jgi:hypothetical protein
MTSVVTCRTCGAAFEPTPEAVRAGAPTEQTFRS